MYKDLNKQLLFRAFQRIEYLSDLNIEVFHRLLYSFKEFIAEEGEVLLRENDPVNSIIIMLDGELEMVKIIDGVPMVLATIRRGASINSRSIMFSGELTRVTLRCKRRANLFILRIRDLNDLINQN